MKPLSTKCRLDIRDRQSIVHGLCDARGIPTHRNGRPMTADERRTLLHRLFPEFTK